MRLFRGRIGSDSDYRTLQSQASTCDHCWRDGVKLLVDPRNELLYAVRQDETDKKTEEGATLDTVIFSRMVVEELDSRLLVLVLVYVY